jgi:hypothetical protein
MYLPTFLFSWSAKSFPAIDRVLAAQQQITSELCPVAITIFKLDTGPDCSQINSSKRRYLAQLWLV